MPSKEELGNKMQPFVNQFGGRTVKARESVSLLGKSNETPAR